MIFRNNLYWPDTMALPLAILFLLFGMSFGLSHPEDKNPYSNSRVLDPEGKYIVEWVVDWQRHRILFNVTAQTRGWVGFGIARKPKMDGADMVMGGVSRNGRIYFSDRHGHGHGVPEIDKSQDYVLHSIWENASHTFLSFSRSIDTGDDEDIPVNDDTTELLWAYAETDTTNIYHYSNRGSLPVHLLDPDYASRDTQNGQRDPAAVGDDVKVWNVRTSFNMSMKKTTYWCTVHKLNLPKKHHIVGFDKVINENASSHVHHATLFRCIGKDLKSQFEPFVDQPGEECYLRVREGQLGHIPTHYCNEVKVGFAIGSRVTIFPEHVGIPIGTSGQEEYYLLQIHYDNLAGVPDLRINTDILIYYTDKLRRNDAGLLHVGHHIPGSPSILVPRQSAQHRIQGHCTPECTQKMLPPGGVKIVGAFLHSHNTGVKLTLQHFRNGRELPVIMDDANARFDYQVSRMRRRESNFLPGDRLTMRCEYDNRRFNHSTVGGFSTDQEMCTALVFHYGFLDGYGACRSEIVSEKYIEYYLAGARNITWNQERLEFVANAPAHLAGMSLEEISDSRYVNWNRQKRAELQRDHLNNRYQQGVCPQAPKG